MAKISQAQRHAASIIAHALWATQLANKVEGMKGFEPTWFKAQTPHDRALVDFFRAELKRIPGDMAKMMEKENDGAPT